MLATSSGRHAAAHTPADPVWKATHMSDPPPYPDSGDDGSDFEANTGTPSWVKILAWAVPVVLLALLVGLHLLGVVGPGR